MKVKSCPYLVDLLESKATPVVLTKGTSLGYSSALEAEAYKFIEAPIGKTVVWAAHDEAMLEKALRELEPQLFESAAP